MTEKLWGTTTPLLTTPFVEIHRLTIEPRMCCSWHKHERKWNAFIGIKGQLVIETDAGDAVHQRVIGPGEFVDVPPGMYHRFRSDRVEAEAIEIYYPDTLSEDIVRRDVGGLLRDVVADAPQESTKPLEKVA